MGRLNKIKLSISKPCTENWDKMTIGEQGKFCSSCQKSVIDFSNYTDRELLNYFTKAKDKICGRISNTQLNRLIVASETANTTVKRFLFGTALTAGLAGTAHSQSTTPTNNITTGTTQAIQKTNKGNPAVSGSTFKINGRIIDSANKQPLPLVSVVIESDSLLIVSTNSDANGKFEINVNKNLLGKRIIVRTQQYAYHDWEGSFTFTKIPTKHITISMTEAMDRVDTLTLIMGDIASRVYPTIKDSAKRGK